MTWLKSSDNANQNHRILAPLAWQREPEDDLDGWDLRLPAIAGLAWLCATYSADQGTDYVVPDGTVALYGGPQWQRLAEWAARAGIWTRVDGGWLLADDSENLFHIRLRAEVLWERQRKNDNGNPALTIPVRLRDGDGCRYCGRVVNWEARTGGLAGTYDHRRPGRAARGPDDLVVACNQCNARRGKDSHPERWHVLPTPAQPYYGQTTVTHLANHGYEVPLSGDRRPTPLPGGPRIDDPPRPDDQSGTAAPPSGRPGNQPDPATGDPATSRTPPTPHRAAASRPTYGATPATGHRATVATPPAAGHRATAGATPNLGHRATAATPPAAEPRARRTTSQDQHRPVGSDRAPAGTAGPKPPEARAPGRDGSGRDGTGRAPTPTPATTNRKRSRRGRRGRPQPQTPDPTQQPSNPPRGQQP